MAPIHDTDVAEERWSKSEWENYELWEKVEIRLKRNKRFWIFVTLMVFLILSAIPIAIDRWPKWITRSISRHMASEINLIKREAGVNRAAYRLKMVGEGRLSYVIERLPNCSVPQGEVVRTGSLEKESFRGNYTWVSSTQAVELGVPGLTHEFCYDYLLGSDVASKSDAMVGMGFIPVKDLAEKRIDRLSILLFSGSSAEISFD